MNIATFIMRIKNHLIAFVHLQLFITLISIPILICWGIPLSLLTFAGNLIFSPILTIFLFLCSIIFFCQMLGIPNQIFIWCLEKITSMWLWLMNQASQNVLVGLAYPAKTIVILLPLCALAILHYKKIRSVYTAIFCYCVLLICTCIYLAYCNRIINQIENITCNKGTITCIISDNTCTLIDPGFIGQRMSAPSWCEYTLMPHLVKKYGITVIDHFVILRPNKNIFDALASLLDKIIIKNIYLVTWHGSLPSHWWKSYFTLQRQCQTKLCNFIRIGRKPVTIQQSKNCHFTADSLDTSLSAHEFTYPAIQISGSLDLVPFKLYTAYYLPQAKQ